MEFDPEKINREELSQVAAYLPSPTELLSDAWEMYKAKWKTFLGIVVVPILFMFFAGIIFAVGLWGSGTIDRSSPETLFSGNTPLVLFILFAFIFLFFLFTFIVQIWSQAALVYAIKENGEIGIKEAYQKSKSKIKQFFWVSILVGFITMGGFIFFAIPGFIFGVWFSFATFIVITEDLKGMDAILKSREYVRNYWWPVFWRFLFINLVMIGIMIVVSIGSMLIPILGNVVSIILTPIVMIYMFLIYNNLREIKGDFAFEPSVKARKSFIAIGVLGFIIIPLLWCSRPFISVNDAKDRTIDATYHSNSEASNNYNNDINNTEKEMLDDNIIGRDLERVSDLKLISTIIEYYKIKTGSYPLSQTISKLNENNFVVREIKSTNENIDIPIDPKNPEYYYGYQSLNGEGFELTARLENADDLRCDLEIKENRGICIYKYQR